MLDSLLKGLFDSEYSSVIRLTDFLLCIGVSLALGLIMALCYRYRTRSTGSFIAALALLPAVVCVVIMMVNGNIGTGVAVAGAFGLVRFRSAQGTAKEICALFLAMGVGLITGMGYFAFAFLFTVIMCAAFLLYSRLGLGAERTAGRDRTMSVTIPEDLDYSGVFDDIFAEYTDACALQRVKTTNMGSMFRLTYTITLKDPAREKEMIDAIRCRNGNLEIAVSQQESPAAEL